MTVSSDSKIKYRIEKLPDGRLKMIQYFEPFTREEIETLLGEKFDR
jgi:hypothetical protein